MNAKPFVAKPFTYKSATIPARFVSTPRAEPINPSIEKESPKVVTTVSVSEIDKKGVYCRCWRSAQFPKCDGTHVKHNKETGDNVGPLIVNLE